MICPACGVDSETYLLEKAKKEQTAKEIAEKEAAFKQVYGSILKSIRRKRALISGIIGAVVGVVGLMGVGWLFLFSIPGGAMSLWEEFLRMLPYQRALILSISLLPIAVSALLACSITENRGKQEKSLRKNFGLPE